MFGKVVFLLGIVFVWTYDHKARTLEKFVGQPTPPTQKSCENTHYEAVQFAQTPDECPTPGKSKMGALT